MNDYEQKYKEALEKAKECLKDGTITNTAISYIETIFPELQENEDERIRKVLVDYFKRYKEQEECGIKTFFGIPTDNIIAWLEKQGEQKPQGKTALEAINEEKVDNANKVEPKFKTGDWVTDGYLHCKISDVLDDRYIVDTKFAKRSAILFKRENNYHLWTIQDAKDGDVIYTPKGLGVEGIFLVSGWQQIEGTGKTLCSNIGYRVDDDEIVEGGLGAIWWKGVKDPFFPATKEQRELLFHKMKEAGYEWDVDKKELKKIKDEIEIQFGAKDSELQEDTYYIPKGFHAEIDKDKVVIKMGKKPAWSEEYIADVFEKVGLAKIVREQSNDALTIALQDTMIELSKFTLQPKPTAWSEEDECRRNQLITFCENCMVQDSNAKKCADWLKSLKNRVQPQNKWKESLATANLENSLCDIQDGFSDTSYEYRTLGEAIEFIRCTESKPQWKPSDEQMGALQYIYRNLNPQLFDKLGWDSIKTLESLYQDLKKLK